MKLLIDGDTPLYRAAAAAQHHNYYIYPKGEEDMGYIVSFRYKRDANAWVKENGVDDFTIESELEVEPAHAAIHNIKTIMGTILSINGGGDYSLYVGGDGNFRYDINPEYKAGRAEKPVHYHAVKEYLVKEYGAEVIDGMEVDDKVSMEQYLAANYRKASSKSAIAHHPYEDTMIISIDKDLDMVPGHHYNWLKQEQYFITEDEGDYNFHIQLLTGDRTDNIRGLDGIGPVNARRLLEGAGTPAERFERCQEAYNKAERDDLEAVARQLWMSKNEPNDWSPPV